MDFYSYNKEIDDLKVVYSLAYKPEIARVICRFIDIIKKNYSHEEIELIYDSLCKITSNPISIENIFKTIKNETNEKERKHEIMSMYEPIENKTVTVSGDRLYIDASRIPSVILTFSDYKEEKDNKLIYGFNVPGIRIKCEEIWNNREKKLSLRFYGENEIFDVKNHFDKTIDVDTDIYEKYDWTVKDGILYVTLFEKINERPDFHRVEKSKSPYKKKNVEAALVESENK